MKLSNENLAEMDRAHLVHPVASWRGHEAAGVRILTGASGAHVTDASGRELLDGFAGLWCVNAGYGHDGIVEAAARQMRELPYATGYFGLGSEAPIRLAAELSKRAPGDLNHVYFTLGGSDAVDSSVRFVRYYFHARGEPQRDQFISLEQGYHGSSGVGAGLTALPVFHHGFGLPLDWQHKIPSPDPYHSPHAGDDAAIIAASTAALRAKAAQIGTDRVAAFYAEPIQGSGGVIAPPKGWLSAMRETCSELGILMIADEVITGFGRTGPLFACADENVTPDLMTTAKGLTSGYVPMGAVFMTDHVYDVIADGAGAAAVGHGFTYSGHPVSAAVGLEVLRLYEEGGLLENGRAMGRRLMEGLRGLRDHPLVGDVRGRGMLAGVELVTDKNAKTPLPAAADFGVRGFQRAWDAGLVIRAFNHGVIGFAPPLCCTAEEIDEIVARTVQVLDQTLADPDLRAAIA